MLGTGRLALESGCPGCAGALYDPSAHHHAVSISVQKNQGKFSMCHSSYCTCMFKHLILYLVVCIIVKLLCYQM